MSDLLQRIGDLTRKAIESEANTANLYLELSKAYEEIGNEKFADVAGLHRPNLHFFINDITNHTDILKQNKFAIESRIDDIAEKENKKLLERWNECIKKIPQKDEFSLEGIETWHVFHYEMIPNSIEMHNPLFREEAIKLIASGFNLAINDDHGTGSIIVTNEGFDIELWQHNKKKVIHKKTLDEVLDYLIYFYEHGNVNI